MHDEPQTAVGNTKDGDSEIAGVEPEAPITKPLRPDHDVSGFVLPSVAKKTNVKDFLVEQASILDKAQYCRVFVWENPDNPKQIWGFYSLSASALAVAAMKPGHKHKAWEEKKQIPMALLGYMGRHNDDRLKSVGPGLIHDAAKRVAKANKELACWGIWLTAHNEKLVEWYQKQNFDRAVPVGKGQTVTFLMYAPLASLLKPGQAATLFVTSETKTVPGT